MNKDLVYSNIKEYIENGFYRDLYFEKTKNIEDRENNIELLETISANIFNAIIISCQLFDDMDDQIKFIDMFSDGIDSNYLPLVLSNFNLSEEEAKERLKHGFGVHFTTPNICNIIRQEGVLKAYGNNALISKEEDEVINNARRMQIENDPEAEESLNYLFKGFGMGVSSYSSQTNRFWMHRTPESLSFLFGNIYERNKENAMNHVLNAISALDEESKKHTFKVMSDIYDRLVGEEQTIGCILIDRDAFTYEVDYYYNTGEPVGIERRPYSKTLNSLNENDCKITNDIEYRNLRFLVLPTIKELERQKKENKQY